MKKYLTGRGCVACCVACGHVGLLMRFLQMWMSVNKNEKGTYLMVDVDALRSSVLAL